MVLYIILRVSRQLYLLCNCMLLLHDNNNFSPKGRHSRCTQLYRAYLDDLGGYPESQEEPAESVRRVAGPSERIWVSATQAPMENVGGPSCATPRYSHPSGIL